MTVKEWFYKHTNITLIIFILLMFKQMYGWYAALVRQEWGLFGFYSLTSIVVMSFTLQWWDKHQ
jgi:hypothetical protein